jgi:hypothetical protein
MLMGRVSVTINNYKMVDFSMQYMTKNVVNLKKLLYYIVPQSSELLITFESTVIVA